MTGRSWPRPRCLITGAACTHTHTRCARHPRRSRSPKVAPSHHGRLERDSLFCMGMVVCLVQIAGSVPKSRNDFALRQAPFCVAESVSIGARAFTARDNRRCPEVMSKSWLYDYAKITMCEGGYASVYCAISVDPLHGRVYRRLPPVYPVCVCAKILLCEACAGSLLGRMSQNRVAGTPSISPTTWVSVGDWLEVRRDLDSM